MSEGEGGTSPGGDGAGRSGPKRDSGTQNNSIKILSNRAMKLTRDYPGCKMLLLYRSAFGNSRENKWLLDIAHNFGEPQQANVLRRKIAHHLAEVGAAGGGSGAGGRRRARAALVLRTLHPMRTLHGGRQAGTAVPLRCNASSRRMPAGGWQGPDL